MKFKNNINKEKLFSNQYGCEYGLYDGFCTTSTDFEYINQACNYLQLFDFEVCKNKSISSKLVSKELKKLPFNLQHFKVDNMDIKYCEVSRRFGPKIIIEYKEKNVFVPYGISVDSIRSLLHDLIMFFEKGNLYSKLYKLEYSKDHLKNIDDVYNYFCIFDNIAISNTLFSSNNIEGYLYLEWKSRDKVRFSKFSDHQIEIPGYYMVCGNDFKGKTDICSFTCLKSYFNSKIYDNKWSLYGIFDNDEIIFLDADKENKYHEYEL